MGLVLRPPSKLEVGDSVVCAVGVDSEQIVGDDLEEFSTDMIAALVSMGVGELTHGRGSFSLGFAGPRREIELAPAVDAPCVIGSWVVLAVVSDVVEEVREACSTAGSMRCEIHLSARERSCIADTTSPRRTVRRAFVMKAGRAQQVSRP